MSSMPLVVCLMGPTATGKTALAIELAGASRSVSSACDSALVYRRMNIGTGKPGARLLAEIPHRLIDIREPWESYSAGEFVRDARTAIAESRGGWPCAAAGRGHDAVFPEPAGRACRLCPRATARCVPQSIGVRQPWAGQRCMLNLRALIRPVPQRLQPTDRQRIQRALEVWQLTGIPLSVAAGPGVAARRAALSADWQ